MSLKGWVGAGDVKLMTVLCLWAGDAAGFFLVAVSLAGGVLVIAQPLVSALELRLAQAVAAWQARTGKKDAELPVALTRTANAGEIAYGPAIAVGAVLTALSAFY